MTDLSDPVFAICDAHHHFDISGVADYPAAKFADEIRASGHCVRSTVYVECGSYYDSFRPAHLRSVGETVRVADAAAQSAHQALGVGKAIVAFVDLTMPRDLLRQAIAAHREASGGLLTGIRQVAMWDADPTSVDSRVAAVPRMYADSNFLAGFELLSEYGLSFDAWQFQTQLGELYHLAAKFPHQPIAINHAGGVLGLGRYAGRREELFCLWRRDIERLATLDNTVLKLSGLGMRRCGFGFERIAYPVKAGRLAMEWQPWLNAGIAAFGPGRVMFGSNFPVDRQYTDYGSLWDSFRQAIDSYLPEEQKQMLCVNAERFYRVAHGTNCNS